jgi:propanol-preferring alcohol dehydrogenase
VGNADHVYAVPDNLKDPEAAPLFCPGITAYGAVKEAELDGGKSVAVFGIGGGRSHGHTICTLVRG